MDEKKLQETIDELTAKVARLRKDLEELKHTLGEYIKDADHNFIRKG